MSNIKRVLAPAMAVGVVLSAWGGASAQSPSAPSGGETCDLTGTTPVTLQLQWVTQAQFAGYFAAKDKCLFAKQGLDVTLQEADPSGTPPQVIGSDSNGPEFTIAWVPKVLELRDKGQSDLVNIAQVLQRSGTLSLAWKNSGITSPADFKGKVIGVWPFGNEYEVTAAISAAGMTEFDYVKAEQTFTMQPFLIHQMDAAMAMTYNELAQVLETTNPDTGELYQPEDLNIINYNDVGTAMLQDALWAREAWLAEPGNTDIATKFLTASFQGWQYCRDNAAECTDIVLNHSPILGAGHQAWMMNEVNALVWPAEGGIGAIPQATWDKTVKIATDAKIITKAPDAAASRSDLAEAARKLAGGDVNGTSFVKGTVPITPGGK